MSVIARGQITISAINDGEAGADAYTVMLTSESHTFAGTDGHATAAATTIGIIAYKGLTAMPATIGTISGAPTGMTVQITGSGTTEAKFRVAVTTSLTTTSGTLTVPLTVDGQSFTKLFSWALSLKGDTGDSAPLLRLTADSQCFKYGLDADGTLDTSSPQPATITITAQLINISSATCQWEVIEESGQGTLAGAGTGTTVTVTPDTFQSDWGTIRCTAGGVSDCITIFKVSDGEVGADGTGIKSIVAYYLATHLATGITTATDGWQTSKPTPTYDKPYLWYFLRTTLTTGATSDTTPAILERYSEVINPNLLSGTGLTRNVDKWTTMQGTIDTATGLTATRCFKANINEDADQYLNVLQQSVYTSSADHILKPDTWYTLSFYVRKGSAFTNYVANSLTTYLYNVTSANGPIDTTEKMYVDGVEKTATIDGAVTWGAPTSATYARHTLTFKTRTTLYASTYLLFRLAAQTLTLTALQKLTNIYLAQIKLEEGREATPWCPSDADKVGIKGCVWRTTEWASGTEYRNDEELETEDTIHYVDVVVVKDSTTGKLKAAYQCIKTHTASSTNKPETDVNATTGKGTYWKQYSTMAPIYTPVIMADQGIISFMQGNQLLILGGDDGTTVYAALQGGDWPLWIGGASATEAPTAFKADGSGKLAAGNLTWDAAGNLTVAGFVRKKKTAITEDNYTDFVEEMGTYSNYTYNRLCLEKTGGWVSFELTTTGSSGYFNKILYFPYYTRSVAVVPTESTTPTLASIEAARALVGSTAIIYNNTSVSNALSSLRLANLVEDTLTLNSDGSTVDKGSSVVSYLLNRGRFVELECVLDTITTSGVAYERIAWHVKGAAYYTKNTTLNVPEATGNQWQMSLEDMSL